MTFEFQPTLEGKVVTVHPLQPQDYDDLYKVAADPLIWEQHPAKNRYREAEFQKFFQESLASGGALIVTDSQSNQVIGSSRFHGYKAQPSEIEIGWTFFGPITLGWKIQR